MDGVCKECGYEQPAPTETPEPTAAPTAEPTPAPTVVPPIKPAATAKPTVEPTAEPTPLPEVIVAEEAETEPLTQLVEKVQAEGAVVTTDVVGVDEVLTEEEYEQMSAISVPEQLVVTLASIGLEDAIGAAVKSQGIELSDQATTLITKVTERQAALTGEEQAAAREKLQELFPVREVVVDGVSYTCYIIDLRIVVDGEERIEQYDISMDEEGQWIFIKL